MTALLECIAVILIADFISGFFHWLEDSYGRADFPITGRLYTLPNIRHHHEPRYFLRHNWLQSSWDLMLVGFFVILIAWRLHLLTWHVWLFVVLGANANQFHKWAHRSREENGRLVSLLQSLRILQTPRHHARHHTNPKNSHYCVITNFLNPVLDGSRFWERCEWIIARLCGIRRRVDASLNNHEKERAHGDGLLGRLSCERELSHTVNASVSGWKTQLP